MIQWQIKCTFSIIFQSTPWNGTLRKIRGQPKIKTNCKGLQIAIKFVQLNWLHFSECRSLFVLNICQDLLDAEKIFRGEILFVSLLLCVDSFFSANFSSSYFFAVLVFLIFWFAFFNFWIFFLKNILICPCFAWFFRFF